MKIKFIDPREYETCELGTMFARTSRTADGWDAIRETVSDVAQNERADKIFKFTEYGHDSILDLCTIPLYIEGINMYQAARLFQVSPTASGQEASTRFINTNPAWEATHNQPRVGGRLDNIRSIIPIKAPTTMGLIQSLRGWRDAINLLARMDSGFGDSDTESLACFLADAVVASLPSKATKDSFTSRCFEKATGKYEADLVRRAREYMLPKERVSGESGCTFNNLFSITSIYDRVPFYLVRDLNRHRRRMVSSWATPDLNATMNESVPIFFRMTINQFRYEYYTRTTKEADPAYKSLYEKWKGEYELD